ncbi:uncharacterized protein [Fopius arisanus]|uniref:Uncharacterized protein isoform X2 n=1 Tax=Fopius arisanus TaxID=64838 RepID=A0A9R1T1W2_9HYME|nr:PREDICTED: uncharacterized protein LOC105265316 isoform X2 [Fopius arisanus]
MNRMQLFGIAIFGIVMSLVSVESGANVVFEKQSRQESRPILKEIRQELMQKSRSNQILNLNLSAVLLLLLLKAAALGATYLGNYDRYKGRKFREDNLVSADEMTLALGYLIGDSCLYRAACEVPETAKEYLGTIDMITEAMKIIPQTSIDNKYEKKISEFRRAIEYGELNSCPAEYTCQKESTDYLQPE